MLATLMGFDYQDQRSLEEWALNHAADHDEIRQAIQAQGGDNLTAWGLYPVNWGGWDAFAERHQSAHNDMNNALGLKGVDLTGVDFKDKKSNAQWHQSHFSEHQSSRAKLKI